MQENEYHSYNHDKLPVGCQYCVRGEKLVIFVTGICPRKCYFCPLSDKKYGKDVIFANELEVKSPADLVKEADNMNAKGAGITGGDPLSKLDRTVEYIKHLKKKFGAQFHIHLYTSLNLVTKEALTKLADAGLDEIRFHPDLDFDKLWGNLELTKDLPFDVGIEIPCIPGKDEEIKKLIDFIAKSNEDGCRISFLNLNELEVADNELSKLGEMGFNTKDDLSYGVEDSVELGLQMIGYVNEKGYKLSVHVCTAKLKDAVQLTNRIKREGKIVKHKFDEMDEEGLLTRGALYLPELAPGVGYRKKLDDIQLKQDSLTKLKPLFEIIKDKLRLRDTQVAFDESKPRILLSKSHARKHKRKIIAMGLMPAIVTEYPTADQLEIEVSFLD